MKHVLIIDDSKFIVALVQQVLESLENITIYTALSFAQAKMLIEVEKINFHIAIVDLNLPDAQNGETVDYINEFEIPTIVLTASSDR
jgi:CheY-like chemotaxis protein